MSKRVQDIMNYPSRLWCHWILKMFGRRFQILSSRLVLPSSRHWSTSSTTQWVRDGLLVQKKLKTFESSLFYYFFYWLATATILTIVTSNNNKTDKIYEFTALFITCGTITSKFYKARQNEGELTTLLLNLHQTSLARYSLSFLIATTY